jgi:hypothetical protein
VRRARVVIFAVAAACIIPDREITFEGGPDNAFAVRIIERTPLPMEMIDICNADPVKQKDLIDLRFCPDVRRSLPSGLIEDPDGPFCICPNGEDERAIPAFTIYAEDGDLDGDDPRDRLRGVFLLDPDPVDDEPNLAVAFNEYWAIGDEAVRVDAEDLEMPDPAGGRTAPNEARDFTPQWRFRIDNGSGFVDLCNGADDIEPGLHNLRFMVTDRPWFERPQLVDDMMVGTISQPGVPDVAGGATYAVTNYVFECIDEIDDTDPRSGACRCAP